VSKGNVRMCRWCVSQSTKMVYKDWEKKQMSCWPRLGKKAMIKKQKENVKMFLNVIDSLFLSNSWSSDHLKAENMAIIVWIFESNFKSVTLMTIFEAERRETWSLCNMYNLLNEYKW